MHRHQMERGSIQVWLRNRASWSCFRKKMMIQNLPKCLIFDILYSILPRVMEISCVHVIRRTKFVEENITLSLTFVSFHLSTKKVLEGKKLINRWPREKGHVNKLASFKIWKSTKHDRSHRRLIWNLYFLALASWWE